MLVPSRINLADRRVLVAISRCKAHGQINGFHVPRNTFFSPVVVPSWLSKRAESRVTLFATRDSANASVDEPLSEAELRREVQRLELEEPAFEAGAESAALTVAAASVFGAGIWAVLGKTKAEEYFAGYLLEQSLSVDNLFVFILVFSYFKTPPESQKKALTVGIATAAVLRFVLILLGADIVERWKPVLLIFAGILLFSSAKLLLEGEADDEEEDLSNNSIVKFCRKLFTFTDAYDGERFFTTLADGTKAATPLLLVLLVIELSDVVFAVDSIPAVFGVTLDPFIVYTSNMFAILSLRGLYSFVANFMSKLKYLDKAVALVLGFVGAKIIAEFAGAEVPTDVSLGIVAAILTTGVGASLLHADGDDSDAMNSRG
jgi:TerC family integral membrane protein